MEIPGRQLILQNEHVMSHRHHIFALSIRLPEALDLHGHAFVLLHDWLIGGAPQVSLLNWPLTVHSDSLRVCMRSSVHKNVTADELRLPTF